MNEHITYLFPSKSRPEKFFAALNNIFDNSISPNYEVIVVFDREDETMNSNEVKGKCGTYHPNRLRTYYDNSTGKIDACNRCIKNISPNSNIICLMSDDFVFTKLGFDNDIREGYADGFKGCLHFPDGRVDQQPNSKHAIGFYAWMIKHEFTFGVVEGHGVYCSPKFEGRYTLPALYQMYYTEQKKRLITFPIMHVEYLRRFNYIYYPEYLSVCADDEMTEVCKKLDQYKFIDKDIMEHRHYRSGFGLPDELMKHNDSPEMYEHDRNILTQRQAINFGL